MTKQQNQDKINDQTKDFTESNKKILGCDENINIFS